MTEAREPTPAPAGRWERYWPRFLAVLQAGLGTFVIVYEVLSGSERLYLIAFAFLAVSGAPLTAAALRILTRSSGK